MLGKATGIAKEHSINKISIVMIAGKFKIMRSGPKTVTVVYLFAVELPEFCVRGHSFGFVKRPQIIKETRKQPNTLY